MSSRTPDLAETIRRRKRVPLPRAPEKTIGERIRGLKGADEKLETLLEELLYLAERETIFTMTLERDRLFSALGYAGFLAPLFVTQSGRIAPGGAQIVTSTVASGMIYCPIQLDIYNSLPWWFEVTVWMDTAPPAASVLTIPRAPEHHHVEFKGVFAMSQFMRKSTTNNHVANFCDFTIIERYYAMTITVWEMIEEIYLKPIAEYAQERAEKETGRPFP